MAEESATGESLDALLEEAEDSLENVQEYLADVESVEELEDDTIEGLLGDVDTLATVATEAVELLETIDLSDLPEAVDVDQLLEAIEVGEVPEVVADDDTGVGDAVDVTELVRALNLLQAWDATELGEMWDAGQELEAAVDDFAETGEDAGMVEEAAASVADEGSELVGEDGLGGEDGLLGGEGDLLEDVDPAEALGDIDVMDDPQAYQIAIQRAAMQGIDAFRAALLETHAKFERLVAFNRDRMRRRDTSTNSRNPTAASTMPTERAAVGSGVKHSTVPQDVRLSTAPSRKRIYGQRFERERQKRRSEDD
ncbi:hypothetical protein [Halopiger goleimassiliensis]|uniref:hypothetical protein n=1 Tax=Halopiger goleimassiliensis TaxID=1293048 RepID=UPI000677659D|nr:hypothetical protein [Halopiger goleimassiliensis]